MGKQVAGIYINGDKLVKEESVTKNSRKVSSIKTTHGNKILPKVKKEIEKYNNSQAQHSPELFNKHIIFVLFETRSVK